MTFDFIKHKLCNTGEGYYSFFDCVVCGARWQRCDYTYVIESHVVLGRCCPECSLFLVKKGAPYEEWPDDDSVEWQIPLGRVEN
jgi:hypothetical protein